MALRFVPVDEEQDDPLKAQASGGSPFARAAVRSADMMAERNATAPLTPEHAQVPTGAEDIKPNLRFVPVGEEVTEPAPPKDRAHLFGREVPALQPFSDIAAGFNESLAFVTGAGLNAVDLVMRDLGTSGFLAAPNDGIEAVTKFMEKHGMAADSKKAENEFAANMGKATFQQMVMLSALFAAAPTMAAMQGTTVPGMFAKDMGKFMTQHPGATVAAEAGAIVGGEVGQQAGGPVGGVLGSMIGGVTGGAPGIIEGVKGAGKSAVTGTFPGIGVGGMFGPEAGIATSMVTAPVNALRGFRRGVTQGRGARAADQVVPDTPLVHAPGTTQTLQMFAKEAVEGDTLRIDNGIMNEINKVKKIADPLRAAEVLRRNLKRAYNTAQQRASSLWEKVDLKRPMNPKPLAAFARQMRLDNSRFAPDSIPSKYITRIGAMARSKKPITINDMRAIRSEILGDLRQHIPVDTMRRNLVLLEKEILKQIETQYPDDKAMAAASEFSRWVHERFSTGPVGKFIRRESGRPLQDTDVIGDVMDPGRAMEAMLRSEKGGKQIRNISQTLDLPKLKEEAGAFIENEFRRIAEDLDARAAGQGRKWLAKPENKRFIKAFPELAAKMQGTYARLGELLDERQIIEQSAFKKFSLEDPQTAVARVFASRNKVKAAQELRSRFADDPDAMRSWKSGVVEELFRGPNWNPKNIWARLNTKDMKAFMNEALGGEDAARLYRNVRTAANIYAGEQGGLAGKLFNRGSSIFGRVLAAKIGNRLGGGDIQTPGLLASAAGRTIDNLLKVVPADTLLANAMIDPKWEKLLFARDPQNIRDMERVGTMVNRLISGMEAGRGAIEDVITDESKLQ